MEPDEFKRKWNETGGISGIRVIVFNGGSIYANTMLINTTISQYRNMNRFNQYYEVTLYRNTGGVSIDVANIRLDKIKDVL